MLAERIIASESRALRILLLEDASFVREGLQSIFRPYRDLELVGMTSDLGEALRTAARMPPDLVAVNLRDDSGLTRIVRELRARLPSVPLLVLVETSDPGIARALRMAGADELLFSFARPTAIIGTLRKLVAGAGSS